jgi:hypothetical protein
VRTRAHIIAPVGMCSSGWNQLYNK